MSKAPYAPPNSPLSMETPREKSPSKFPYTLIIRWAVCLLLAADGLYPLYFKLTNWQLLSERAIIDPTCHPAPHVIFAVLTITAAALLSRRSKWAVPLFATHLFGAIIYWLVLRGHISLTSTLASNWALEGIGLWYMLNEWAHGRLR